MFMTLLNQITLPGETTVEKLLVNVNVVSILGLHVFGQTIQEDGIEDGLILIEGLRVGVGLSNWFEVQTT